MEVWAGRRPAATVIPEGGDDIEMRGARTTFVQVKSRREHLGSYSAGEAARHIEDLWARSRGSSPLPDRFELILERSVAGVPPVSDGLPNVTTNKLVGRELKRIAAWERVLPSTSVSVARSPQESSIATIVERMGCVPLAAQMCFAELLNQVGRLADANGTRSPERYAGLSTSDTERVVSEVLAATDVHAMERAIRNEVCQPVDFLTTLPDSNFYLGVDVEPGHVAAGLVAERPEGRQAILRGLEERRAALVIGPSGAGKSALMWEAAHALRHTVRWFRVRRAAASDIPAVRQLMRTFRASKDSPLGLAMDDVGRTGPETWGALIEEVMSVSGVVLLGSIREEDVVQITNRARVAEVRAEPDDELARRLWDELRDREKTDWPGWREPWASSKGLLLEYVHTLTQGRRMDDVLRDQVAARVLDPARALELDVLRCGAWAGTVDAELDVARLAVVLHVPENEVARALLRLVEEHLVRSPTAGGVAGLHRLRSEKLLRLTHETALPTLAKSFTRTAASVPSNDLEPLIAEAISEGHLAIPVVVESLVDRLERERDHLALAAALRGLGMGRVRLGVEEWLATPETEALPRTQVGTAAMLGIANVDLGIPGLIPDVQAAAHRLVRIKETRGSDPRRMLVEAMSDESISAHIGAAGTASIDEILASLVDVDLSDLVRSALQDAPADLMNADLKRVASALGTLAAIDRHAACRWVESLGQETLFNRIRKEVAWAGEVSVKGEDDGTVVSCDLWHVAPSLQDDAHAAVVELCELMLALCPTADVARSSAVTAGGGAVGVPGFALADKRIPREKLPSPCVAQWNRRWWELVARRVATPSYSEYLARATAILEELVPVLERVFDAHMRGKDVLGRLADKLNSLNARTEALTPPAVSAYDAAGTGDRQINNSVTPLQNLLHSASVNLVKRFAKLPDGAGAYIAWLNSLIADADAIERDEPWELMSVPAPKALARLKVLMVVLRSLAGEAHERQTPPVHTWLKHGKHAQRGKALRLVGVAAGTSTEQRLKRRKAAIERDARQAGVQAAVHIREDPSGTLPWPPSEVLVLLPAEDMAHAVAVVEDSQDVLRSIVDEATRLTIVPVVDGKAVAALSKSGYGTLYPDANGATTWSEHLGMGFQSETADTLSRVLEVAAHLGAMDSRSLGLPDRPPAEIDTRERLAVAFRERRAELVRQLEEFDDELGSRLLSLVATLRTGEIDYMAEAQDALGGVSSPTLEEAGYLTLCLLEEEWARQRGNEDRGV